MAENLLRFLSACKGAERTKDAEKWGAVGRSKQSQQQDWQGREKRENSPPSAVTLGMGPEGRRIGCMSPATQLL
jgi:hypothetical protein